MATGDGLFSSIPILGDVLSLLRTPLGEAAVSAGVAAFGGSDGSSGSGSAGGKGFVPQENPVLTAARSQAFRDISRSATAQERSERAPRKSNTASQILMNKIYATQPRSLNSLYNNIQAYAAAKTPRVVPKTRG
jgi:hypothetical protein